MTGIVKGLRWVGRIDGVIALILGFMLWTGSTAPLQTHILTGFVMTITLLLIGMMGFFSRIKPVLSSIAIAWAILLPFIGFAQTKWMVGAGHMLIRIIHLLIGLCAMGIVDACAGRIIRADQA